MQNKGMSESGNDYSATSEDNPVAPQFISNKIIDSDAKGGEAETFLQERGAMLAGAKAGDDDKGL